MAVHMVESAEINFGRVYVSRDKNSCKKSLFTEVFMFSHMIKDS